MLLRLAYVSQLKPDMSEDRINQLVSDAAFANNKRGVTGIIALEGFRVCQVIEGDPETIKRLYASIRVDPRHTGVTELDRVEVTTRRYPDWSMVRRPMIDMVLHAYAVL